MDIVKIPQFITEDECDVIIEELSSLAGDRKAFYGVGLSYGENPLDVPRIKDILWSKLQLLFGRRSYVNCWGNILSSGMQVEPHKHRDKTDRRSKGEKYPYRCTNLFLGGDPSIGTIYGKEKHINKRGELVVFSSELVHSVPVITSSGYRFSLIMDFMSTKVDEDWIKLN